MADDVLAWLQEWYLRQCDGDWEHRRGVTIDTLDNPGWSLEIDLVGTPLETMVFATIDIQRDETDWVRCWIADSRFKPACGPRNLAEAIQRFRGADLYRRP